MNLEQPSMNGRICLVTGATSGIGAATALGLARLGATVILVGRDKGRGEQVRRRIEAATKANRATLLTADFTSQQSLRDLATRVQDSHKELHVLVNNAGIIATRRRLTEDGIEHQFAVNHLAPFLLTNLLLDTLKRSAPSRIINVSSVMHAGRRLNFDDLRRDGSYETYRVYGETKLANVLFTYELARRLNGSGVTVNCLHPGVVRTNITRDMKLPIRFLMKAFGFVLRSPTQGAATSVYLAASPEVDGVTGKYFVRCAEQPSSPESHDAAAAKRLREVSEAMTGVTV